MGGKMKRISVKTYDARTKNETLSFIDLEEDLKEQEELLLRSINQIFQAAQTKGMPFTANDGQTYHMQARDKDRINVLGLYTSAKDFMTSGSLVEFTPYEDVKAVYIERDVFVEQIAPAYFAFFSAIHFARKKIQKDIANGNIPEDLQAAFDQAFQTILSS